MLAVLVLLPNPAGLDVAVRPECVGSAQTSAVKTASLLATRKGEAKATTAGVNRASCERWWNSSPERD